MNPCVLHPAEMKDFVGRKADYQELQQLLKGKSSIILVAGAPGIGKTSFLNNVLYHNFEPQPIFIEYRSKGLEREFVIPDLYRTSEIPHFRELVEKLNTLRLKFTFSGCSPSQEDNLPEAFSKAADIFELNKEPIADIQNTLKKIKGNIVVLVKNVQSLPAEQVIFEMLVNTSPNFFVILDLSEREAYTLALRDYELIELYPLSREESMEMIRKGISDEDIAEAVYDICKGYPYCVQVLCWVVHEKTLRGDDISEFIDVSKEDPEDLYDNTHLEILAVLDPDPSQLFVDLSYTPSVLTLKVLKAFSHIDNLDDALSVLMEKGILSRREDIFRVHLTISLDSLEYLEDEIEIDLKDFKDTFLEAVQTLKKDDDCIFLLDEMRQDEPFLLEVIREIENEKVLLGFGTDELYSGSLTSAQACFERGLQLDGELKSFFLARLGIVFQRVEELDKALSCYRKALQIHKKTGYRQGESDQLENIGWICKKKRDFDEAAACYEKALEIDRELKDKRREADHLGYICAVYRGQGDLDKALACSMEALEIDRELQYKEGEAAHLKEVGVTYTEKGDFDTGLANLKKALKMFTFLGVHQGISETYAHIFDVFIRKDDPVTAFSYMKKALEYTQDEEYMKKVFIVILMAAKRLVLREQWEYLKYITTIKGPYFGKELNSFLTVVGCYAKYKLSGNKLHLRDYRRRKKKLIYPLERTLNELFRRE